MKETDLAETVRVVGAEMADGRIVLKEPPEKLGAAIDKGFLVILRGAFSADAMRELRRAILEWAAEHDPFPAGESASRPGINHHRVDDGSAPTMMAHVFHQFGFGNLGALPVHLSDRLGAIRASLLELQNRLAGTAFPLDAPAFRIKVIRHPRGGGHLVWHTHPYLPQRVALFLNLSEPGVDYRSGGARFVTPAGEIDCYELHGIGDILAWRYDMAHNVSTVDAEVPLDWTADDGYWLFAMEMIEAYGKSKLAE